MVFGLESAFVFWPGFRQKIRNDGVELVWDEVANWLIVEWPEIFTSNRGCASPPAVRVHRATVVRTDIRAAY